MLNELLTFGFRRLGGAPCFRVHGKARRESAWRVIDVFATHRRDADSRWPAPFWRGTCITWTSAVIVVGWDFAAEVYREQYRHPASRDHPVEVAGGCLRDVDLRAEEGGPSYPWASEVLAHECGHTAQARRLGALYLPVVGALTLFREGPHWWNHFENDASAQGQFGGLVNGSVRSDLIQLINNDLRQ
jgi:hypothetical protein